MIINALSSAMISNNNSMINRQVSTQSQKEESTQGYADKKAAPTNAELYKSMYGVKSAETEEEKYARQMAEFRAKYELDVDDKNREIERNKNKEQQQTEEKEEKSFYEQYLEYKHKYE
ncbi:MAG: hypothetical protein K6C94_00115 [Candidatus Gastranaerophilales bacterium]|nr:hypothetical protein [Candidatus Gastranaerophilales bacterium]